MSARGASFDSPPFDKLRAAAQDEVNWGLREENPSS